MNLTRTVVTRTRALALATLLGIAASGAVVPSAHAEPIGGGSSGNPPCYIPGSDLPYVTGDKATFSLNGQPAKEHTCQKDGTWTAIVVTGTGPLATHWLSSGATAVFSR
jgi:hypothetical protein